MKYVVKIPPVNPILKHHGIKGQKWGRRRYQNDDGSLTEAGKKRYNTGDGDDNNKSNLPAPTKSNSPSSSSSGSNLPAPRNLPVPASAKDKTEFKPGDDGYEIQDAPNSKSTDGGSSNKKADYVVDNPKDGKDYKESFKPGDDGYEVHDAPKSKSSDGNSSTSRPKDYIVKNPKEGKDFEDKSDEPKRTREEIHRDAEKKRREEEREKKENERDREQAAEKREREEIHRDAEKKRREEEREKKENERDREQAAEKREREEQQAKKDKEADKKKLQKEIDTLNAGKTISNDSANIAREMANISSRRDVKVPRMNLKGKTDAEMRSEINREILERQYDDYFNTAKHKAIARRDRTTRFFQNVGSGITVAGSALSIAVAVKTLMKK